MTHSNPPVELVHGHDQTGVPSGSEVATQLQHVPSPPKSAGMGIFAKANPAVVSTTAITADGIFIPTISHMSQCLGVRVIV